eukprot:gnl/MRDRNA2_/MRDRNA2_185434_c0_seq1.p1 gnl/MRDRNA2_/MRDRNA2_185434_c0~~gnl/MRDRNA2_/MRDRNA2_185434_c0_seq1.p1  ORF type:complete len:297 (-),score=51.84 gnl/MRDRNA2_/MRDRNA2_185434_c0_seq1:43-876(-)
MLLTTWILQVTFAVQAQCKLRFLPLNDGLSNVNAIARLRGKRLVYGSPASYVHRQPSQSWWVASRHIAQKAAASDEKAVPEGEAPRQGLKDPVTVVKIWSGDRCSQSTLENGISPFFSKLLRGFKDGDCNSLGYTEPDGAETMSLPIVGDINMHYFVKPGQGKGQPQLASDEVRNKGQTGAGEYVSTRPSSEAAVDVEAKKVYGGGLGLGKLDDSDMKMPNIRDPEIEAATVFSETSPCLIGMITVVLIFFYVGISVTFGMQCLCHPVSTMGTESFL